MFSPLFYVPPSKWIMNLQQKEAFHPSFSYLIRKFEKKWPHRALFCSLHQHQPETSLITEGRLWCKSWFEWGENRGRIGQRRANAAMGQRAALQGLAGNTQSCCYMSRGNALSFKDLIHFSWQFGLGLLFFFPQKLGGVVEQSCWMWFVTHKELASLSGWDI